MKLVKKLLLSLFVVASLFSVGGSVSAAAQMTVEQFDADNELQQRIADLNDRLVTLKEYRYKWNYDRRSEASRYLSSAGSNLGLRELIRASVEQRRTTDKQRLSETLDSVEHSITTTEEELAPKIEQAKQVWNEVSDEMLEQIKDFKQKVMYLRGKGKTWTGGWIEQMYEDDQFLEGKLQENVYKWFWGADRIRNEFFGTGDNDMRKLVQPIYDRKDLYDRLVAELTPENGLMNQIQAEHAYLQDKGITLQSGLFGKMNTNPNALIDQLNELVFTRYTDIGFMPENDIKERFRKNWEKIKKVANATRAVEAAQAQAEQAGAQRTQLQGAIADLQQQITYAEAHAAQAVADQAAELAAAQERAREEVQQQIADFQTQIQQEDAQREAALLEREQQLEEATPQIIKAQAGVRGYLARQELKRLKAERDADKKGGTSRQETPSGKLLGVDRRLVYAGGGVALGLTAIAVWKYLQRQKEKAKQRLQQLTGSQAAQAA